MKVLTFAERFVWAMISVLVLLIVAFAILGWAENSQDGNILGRFATWVNKKAQPQA